MNRKQRKSLADSLSLDLNSETEDLDFEETFLSDELSSETEAEEGEKLPAFGDEAQALVEHLENSPNGETLKLIYEFIFRQSCDDADPFMYIYNLESWDREGANELTYLRIALQMAFEYLTEDQAKQILNDLFADWVDEWQDDPESTAYVLDESMVERWSEAIE